MHRGKQRSSRGFTLLELIIVIIVIGVLASLAIPRFLKMTYHAEAVEALAQLKIIRQAFNNCQDIYCHTSDLGCKFRECAPINKLPIDDPNLDPSRKFDYRIGFGIISTSWRLSAIKIGSIWVGTGDWGGADKGVIFLEGEGYWGVCAEGAYKFISKPGCAPYEFSLPF